MKLKFIVVMLFGAAIVQSVQAQKFEGLAPTPPMGWNSWNTFATNISEALVKQTADYLVSSGMHDAGYEYLVLDDGWMAMERDAKTGDLVPDPKKFPNGLEPVVAYVHSKGLKFGLYNCAGTKTCAGYPGTRGYEYQDARFYARMQVDYLKYDWCNTEGINAQEAYRTMSLALKTAGRPIVFSLCEWGTYNPWEWAAPIGHLWRTSGDIFNCFDCEENHGTWSSWGVTKIIDMRQNIRHYAGPDHWNDMDMLEVGNGMTEGEDRAHFAMWCMMASPLIAGNDVRSMSKATQAILTHKGAIAISQDAMGIQAFMQLQQDSVDVWVKPLADDEWAYCFLNRSQKPAKLQYDFKQHAIADTVSKKNIDFSSVKKTIHNVWTGAKMGTTDKLFQAQVAPHDVLLIRLKNE